MQIAGIEQSSEQTYNNAVVRELRKLLELQGDLMVELIDSARVPGPSDGTSVPGKGFHVDIHV